MRVRNPIGSALWVGLSASLLASPLAYLAGDPAFAQAPASPRPAPAPANATAHPLWRELSPEQREALGPLQSDWEKFDSVRKKKWLEIAAKYPNMSPEGKQRLHERMPQLAKLTPEQRETARENFQNAYALPAEKRQAVTQKYQQLPEDRKKALAAQARAKKPAATAQQGVAHSHPAPASHKPATSTGQPAKNPAPPATDTGSGRQPAH